MSPLGGGAADVVALSEYGEATPGIRSNFPIGRRLGYRHFARPSATPARTESQSRASGRFRSATMKVGGGRARDSAGHAR